MKRLIFKRPITKYISGSFISSKSFSSINLSRFQWPSAKLGIEEAETPPSSWYLENDFYKYVEERVTFNRWIVACRSDEVPQEGDYLATTINNQPIVIFNTGQGYKTFYNVCRHHAAQICDEGRGNVDRHGRVTCPYHGWQYNVEGKLVKAVQMKGCRHFSPKDFGLKAIATDCVGPWIFLHLGTSPTGHLLEDQPDLKELFSMLEKTRYESLSYVASQSYRIKCNWKVFIDNYLDGGYHVPVAHKDLASTLNLKSYSLRAFDSFFLQSCPPKALSEESNSSNGLLRRINSGNDQPSLYAFHYPNLCINRYGQWMDTNIVWPISAHECEVRFDWFVEESLLGSSPEGSPLTRPSEDSGWSSQTLPQFVKESLAQSEQVQFEDMELCERVQRGLQSRGYETGRYAPLLETGEFFFHQKLHLDLTQSIASDMCPPEPSLSPAAQ